MKTALVIILTILISLLVSTACGDLQQAYSSVDVNGQYVKIEIKHDLNGDSRETKLEGSGPINVDMETTKDSSGQVDTIKTTDCQNCIDCNMFVGYFAVNKTHEIPMYMDTTGMSDLMGNSLCPGSANTSSKEEIPKQIPGFGFALSVLALATIAYRRN